MGLSTCGFSVGAKSRAGNARSTNTKKSRDGACNGWRAGLAARHEKDNKTCFKGQKGTGGCMKILNSVILLGLSGVLVYGALSPDPSAGADAAGG